LIERDMFQDRIKEGLPVYMHEMLYPVIQGIDSNAISNIYGSCDLEVGGTDQLFNMLVGRDVMEMNKKEPQAVLSFRLLEGTDGKEKMSKSLDNYIGITDEPNDMYGKVMSIPDSSITNYFELCTFTPMEEVEEIKNKIEKGKVNPKDIKMNLAKQIVAIYHGEEKAQKAEESFVSTFQKGEIPEEMTELEVKKGETLMNALVEAKILSSKGDFRRLIEEGAVTDLKADQKIIDVNFVPKSGMKFRIGKKKFIKII
jgi:tyrosyl-tRNA synthetase